jgi:ferrous iron transport protein A
MYGFSPSKVAFLPVLLRTFVTMKVQEEKVMRLSKLRAGTKAVITSHDESEFQLTLMEMGCIPGEPVWVEMIAPMGDPMAIQIAGYYLSIRKKDADMIWVTTE